MDSMHGRRTRERLVLGAAGTLLVLALAGCGSSGGSAGEGTPTTKAPATTTTTAAATTTTDAATTPTAGATTSAPATSTTAPAGATPVLTGQGLGPLSLGQSLDAAKATGWVGTDIGTCELAGDPPPGTYGFRLDGAGAPDGLDATISVVDDKVATIVVRGGAEMANDVAIGPFGAWTPDLAIKALNLADYEIAYETIFEPNDLAKVTSPGGDHYELSLTTAGVDVAVPHIEACE